MWSDSCCVRTLFRFFFRGLFHGFINPQTRSGRGGPYNMGQVLRPTSLHHLAGVELAFMKTFFIVLKICFGGFLNPQTMSERERSFLYEGVYILFRGM